MIEEKEIWKDIKNYEGLYQVSNFGRVRSVYHEDSRGHHVKGRMLAGVLSGQGYFRVNLYRDGNMEHKLTHRLVASAFIPNPNEYPQINHRDENKANNRADNLEWCSALYNNTYGTRAERAAKSKERPIYAVSGSGHRYFFESARKAAELLGLDRSAVSRCLHGNVKHHHGFQFELAV